MKNSVLSSKIKSSLAAVLFIFSMVAGVSLVSKAQSVKNVVIVHGAFADGSGWKGVHDILVKKGYHVSIVQNPLTSLQADVDATNRIIDRQDGPVILVGHSWGGTIITEAGVHPKVAALVYVAAFQPDQGENTIQWATSLPSAPESGLGKPDDKGFIYYDKAKFRAGFAADLSQEETDFMYASQQPIFAESFGTPLKNAAWKTKPAYGIIATEDKSIVPQIQTNMYTRSNSKITKVKGSHVIYISQPNAVANVIIQAATAAVSKK